MESRTFILCLAIITFVNTPVSLGDDNPTSVEGLKAVDAEIKYDENGSIVEIDLSERDDIDDEVLRHLSGLPKLKRFHAIYTRISGAGFKHLSHAKNLEVLDLYACPINDDGLEQIGNLLQLREVNLIGSQVSDKSIELLKRWKRLEYLGVGDSRISPAGIKDLRTALLDCNIE